MFGFEVLGGGCLSFGGGLCRIVVWWISSFWRVWFGGFQVLVLCFGFGDCWFLSFLWFVII